MVVMIRRNSFINCPFIRGARMPTTARGPCSLQHIVTNLSMLQTKSSTPPFGKVERRWSASGLRLAREGPSLRPSRSDRTMVAVDLSPRNPTDDVLSSRRDG